MFRLTSRSQMTRRTILGVEPLEPRAVPATFVNGTTLTYQDLDGDSVTVKFSKSILTAGNVNSVFTFSTGAMAVNGVNTTKEALWTIDLTTVAGAAGTTVTTTATRNAITGGDGFATLGELLALGTDLGAVTIDGDVGRIEAGDTTVSTAGLNGLKVQSLGRFGTTTGAQNLHSVIRGKLTSLTVASDVRHAFVEVIGGGAAGIGAVTIRGSLLGTTDSWSGRIAATGDIASVTIGGDITGGIGPDSGSVVAQGKIGTISIGGSIQGALGTNSGRIAGATLGTVKVAGKVAGGMGEESGEILSQGAIAGITIGGSLTGGGGAKSGRVYASDNVGLVNIGGDVIGTSDLTGSISSLKKMAGVTIGGKLVGGTLPNNGSYISGRIYANELGPVSIGGDVVGGSSQGAGSIQASVKMAGVTVGGSLIGGTWQNSGSLSTLGSVGAIVIKGNIIGNAWDSGRMIVGTIASLTIGGSLIGSAESGSAHIHATGDVGAIKIGGSIVGGGFQSGALSVSGKVASISVGGSLLAGSDFEGGSIKANGEIKVLTINGDIVGGTAIGNQSLSNTGCVLAQRIGTMTLGGSLVAGFDLTAGTYRNNGAICTANDIGSLTIKGAVIGNATNAAIISARGQTNPTATTDLAISKLTVMGRVERALILAGAAQNGDSVNADAQIGTVTIRGDWVASSLAAGIAAVDGEFGNDDDVIMMGASVKDTAATVSRITSLTIDGQVLGTFGGTDSFGVVAEILGAIRIGGTALTMTSGAGNDDELLGITGDFRVNEV